MSKTIKQAERYEAPALKKFVFVSQKLMATSGQMQNWQEEDVTGSWGVES